MPPKKEKKVALVSDMSKECDEKLTQLIAERARFERKLAEVDAKIAQVQDTKDNWDSVKEDVK
jgi:hypothetical protein